MILQLSEKDALTGLLNRQSFYASTSNDTKDLNALVSIDMNGLKAINDQEGHAAGDKALATLAFCFLQATSAKDSVYRLGGDEFVIVCRKVSEEDVQKLVKSIRSKVSETPRSAPRAMIVLSSLPCQSSINQASACHLFGLRQPHNV